METKGTYAAMRFSNISADAIHQICVMNGVPNPTPFDKLHVTLLYSRKHMPDYKAKNWIGKPIIARPLEFVVWETNVDSSVRNKCLVLKLSAPDLIERHHELRNLYGGTHDYPSFEPHVTLSYDIGDFDVSTLSVDDLPNGLALLVEFQEDLNLNWAATV